MRKSCKILFLVFLILLFTVSGVLANNIELYLFHGEECPHCISEKEWLDTIEDDLKQSLNLHMYETWHDAGNAELADEFRSAYGIEKTGVPLTIIGEKYWVGFSDAIADEMMNYLLEMQETGAVDPFDVVKNASNYSVENGNKQTGISLPIIGKVDLKNTSLLVSTIIIGLVDGVNPCSLWVLTMLLAMIIHTKSRKKALAVGFVYLTITAGIYALFIVGVFSLFNYASYLTWIRMVVAAVTLVLGIINVKDFFYFKKGVSLTISDDKKPEIYKKMRNIVANKDNFAAMIGATVVLAAGVSLVEFSCTAAFPVIWGNLVSSAKVSRVEFAVLLLVYMVLYQLDEIVIYLIAVFTMKSNKMEEKHGRILKLFSGLLMVVLSGVMLIKPDLMNNITSSVLVFAAALALTALLSFVTGKVKK